MNEDINRDDIDKKLDADEDAASGVHFVTDSGGRRWRIRIFEIGRLWRFSTIVAGTVNTKIAVSNQRWWVLFFREMLMHPGPNEGLIITIRRLLGMSDYSTRYIKKNVKFVDAANIREECFKANWGDEYQKIIDDSKKKQDQIIGGN